MSLVTYRRYSFSTPEKCGLRGLILSRERRSGVPLWAQSTPLANIPLLTFWQCPVPGDRRRAAILSVRLAKRRAPIDGVVGGLRIQYRESEFISSRIVGGVIGAAGFHSDADRPLLCSD